jgi:glycosyltransferase involved in cell wall biosynthesis
MTQKPIAIASPRYAPEIGGVERHVEELARGLVARGIPVEVLTTDPTGTLPPAERLDGVVVRRFPTLAHDGIYHISPRLLRWAYGRSARYRLVHAHSHHTLVPMSVRVGADRARLPLVVTPHYHGSGHTLLRDLLHVPYRPVAGRLLRRAQAVIAVSEAEASLLRAHFGELPLHVLPNGVEMPDRTPEPASVPTLERGEDEVTLLSVGRLEAYKGVDRIVGALPHLPPRTVLTVVGKGPESEAILAAAERLGVGDRVRLLGHVRTALLNAWYAAADLFVTLSREEAFGMTVLEAAAAGAPVLASDIPAHREVSGYVAPGRIALVDKDATGQALAQAITGALTLGRSDSTEGWRLPTWDAMVDGVVSVYEGVLGEPLT